jgi:hypothetical protein
MVFSVNFTPYTATLGGLSGFSLQMGVATIGEFRGTRFPSPLLVSISVLIDVQQHVRFGYSDTT